MKSFVCEDPDNAFVQVPNLGFGVNGTKRPLIVTLFCTETRDENVVREDEEMFSGVATFHNTDELSCLEVVDEILRET